LKEPDAQTIARASGAREKPMTPEHSLSRGEALAGRYQQVREFSTRLCQNLQAEDYVVQSTPDVSPTKWHLAHTTWFFETFVLKVWMQRYRTEVPQYAFLFNSYYNAAGDMHRRDLRGLISRPTVAETYRYRTSVDDCLVKLLRGADDALLDEIEPVLILGINHEQQHQELLITDIKHVFSQNPVYPVFEEAVAPAAAATRVAPQHFVEFEETIAAIGHSGNSFSYDNEGPRHRALVPGFALSNRPITNGEYMAFIEAGGYTRPEFWLSLGWTTVNEQRWEAPLYWARRDGAWWNFTLSGFAPSMRRSR
jgi:ergothioneine biosynthesis protein EgtB